MRKQCSNVCKLRPCLATESINSARVATIVTIDTSIVHVLYTYYKGSCWRPNFKIVNSFEDIQYKMCYKDFKYFYTTYIYCRNSKIGKIMKLSKL
jgi:hypothetical protein